ncbi:PIR Superfamily Protein [Plasmodium ovale wallikeri]|uniref:PIR Superfamily Protein n=1 Tax=Plasmodium ovale wallikeri TaxID=864142 RepID=A0A1A9ALY6_PLAOA|nr:PIR Superfamily Protein [Plasmodium ovale wallikeri]SBT58058.1 PIR Superfamily Protein [Plasmodium ovale wallikeri]
MGNCENELKSLESFSEYSRFDMPESSSHRSEHCQDELPELSSNHHFKSFCSKFTNNYTNIISKWIPNGYNNENCEYLNYWTYSELISNNFNVDENDISNSRIINDMTKLWNNYNKDFYKDCKFKIYNMSIAHFQHMKQLYDYSKDYSRIKANHCLDNLQCKPCYCMHIKKVISAFNLVKAACQSNEGNELCTLYSSIAENKNPESLLNDMQCTDESVSRFATGEPSGEVNLGSSLEGSSSRAGLNAGLSILGISVISFFVMYKFTPFQSWLNTITRGLNRNKYFVVKEENNEILSYSSETEDENLQNNELNLSYNPLLNF